MYLYVWWKLGKPQKISAVRIVGLQAQDLNMEPYKYEVSANHPAIQPVQRCV
jgi:hypothetical protein